VTEQAEPPRYLLRPAGVLTQLSAAACLLLGTIAFVLVQQNKSGGVGLVIAWAAGSMAALVFGGLMARGSLVSLLVSAALDAAFGIILLVIDYDTVRAILRVLPDSDVQMIADILVVAAVIMLAIAALCLASIPQALRYAKAFREAVEAGRSSTALPTVPGGGPQPAHLDEGPTDPMQPIIPTAASTNRGWTPHKATGHTTMMIIRPPAEEARSRRRIYIALGGFAIGLGAGMGVLVSSGAKKTAGTGSATSTSGGSGSSTGSGSAVSGPGTVVVVAGPGSDAGSGSAGPPAVIAPAPTVPFREVVTAQREAIAKGDAKAYALTLSPTAFAFGIDGEDVVEGRVAIEEMLVKHIGDAPPGGFTVESKFLAVGGEQDHAWTAEDLELSGGAIGTRRITITQLAKFADGKWLVQAVHWGRPVADGTAVRMAILGTLPRAAAIPNRHDGSAELDKAVRAAFASRAAFADARSEREDGFNFGSGPGERVVGGVAIKRLFGRLRSELKLDGGAARVGESSKTIGWAAVNVVYTQKSQAATDVSQTFRVLAVLVREGDAWKIVQTHFSNAGPIR
jgi:ketosteroid isomerase-like protein